MSTTKNNLEDFDSDEWGNTNLPGLSDEELFNPRINVKLANKQKANDPNFRENLSKALTGLLIGDKNPMYGKNHTEEMKKKLGEDRAGEKHWFYNKKRPEHAKAMAGKPSGKAGKPSSENTKLKISNAFIGNKNPMYGKKHSEETLKKMMEKLICPYCKLEGGKSNMKRWHFDNCKHKL